MRIIKSTDGNHLGKDIQDINTGDTVDLGGFLFFVQSKTILQSGNVMLSNPNYQLECEEL